MAATLSKWQQLYPISGNDGRIRYYVRQLVNGVAINNDDVTKLTNSPIEEVMQVGNYGDKKQNQNPTDIAPQFTDFVIIMALFHKMIDPPDRSRPTADKNNSVADLVNKIFAKWSDLDPDTQTFYQKYIQLLHKNIPISPTYYETIARSADKSNLSVSLIKAEDIDSVPKFWETIPYLMIDKSTPTIVWYHDQHNNLKGVSVPYDMFLGKPDIFVGTSNADGGSYFLRDIYWAIYNGHNTTLAALGITDIPTDFNKIKVPDMFEHFKIDEVIKKKLFMLHNDSTYPTISIGEPVFDCSTLALWKRDESGKLYTNRDGEKIYLDKAHPDDLKKLIKHNYSCYSSGLYKSREKCETLMSKCILSDNSKESVDNCVKFLTNTKDGFLGNIEKEFRQMTPKIAIRILQKLKFKKVHNMINNIPIIQIQNVDSWLADRSNSLTADQKRELSYNSGLMLYLRGLVDILNRCNIPAMNKSIREKTLGELITTVPPNRNESADSWGKKHGLIYRPFDRVGSTEMLSSGLDALEANIQNSLLGIGREQKMVVKLPIPLYGSLVGGGSMIQIQSGGRSMLFDRTGYSGKGHHMIGQVYTYLKDRLTTKNKAITASDDKNILSYIEKMKFYEDHLVKQLRFIELYADLVDADVEKDGSTEITYKKLEDTIIKYNETAVDYSKQELSLLKIMKTVNELAEKERSDSAVEVPGDVIGVDDV
jgi:hypothetical protein